MYLPRVLRPLRQPALACLWAGLATSSIGDQLFTVALSWIAVQVLGTRAGYLTALAPAVVVGVALLAGRWADRLAPRRMMIAADLFRAASLTALVAAWLASGRPGVAVLVAAVVALSAGEALFRPAIQAALPMLAGDPALLPAANGLLETTARLARMVGPGLVGLLAAFVPLVHYVSLDVATFLVSALAVAATLRLHPGAPHRAPPRLPVLRSMVQGFAAMWRHRLLGFSIATAGPTAGIWNAVLFLAVPLLLARVPGGGLASFGLVLSCYGCTNLLGAFLIGGAALPRHPAWLIFGADVVMGAGLGTIGLSALLLPPHWQLDGFCAGAAASAFGGPMSDIPVAVLRQTRLPPNDQAAAMRATLIAWNGGALVCLAAAPLAFAAVGVAATVVAASSLIVLSGVVGIALHHRRHA
jgi:MFS family permease